MDFFDSLCRSDYYFELLGNAAYRYIVKEFMTIAEQSNELMKLTWEEFRRIIEDSQLNVKREECVWDVLLQWVDEDPDNRKTDLVHLLPMVRFGLMDSKYFIDHVIYVYIKMFIYSFRYAIIESRLTVADPELRNFGVAFFERQLFLG